MRKLEILLTGLFLISFTLFFIDIPGGSLFGVAHIISLSLLYLLFGFAIFNKISLRKILKESSYANTSKQRIFGTICLGIALSITLMGILFRLMFWPGSTFNLSFGLILLVIIMILSIVKFMKNNSSFYKMIMLRITLFGSFALLLFAIPQMALVKIKYRNDPTLIEAFRKALENPENEKLRDDIEKEREKRLERMNNGL